MQNKERLLELQSVFSRRHVGLLVAMLLFIANYIIMNNGNDGLKFSTCIVICAVLLADIIFAYFSFFHKYVLIMILRFAELIIVGVMISDTGDTGVGGISDVFAVLFYAMFMIETVYLFDLTDNTNIIKISFLGQIPFVIKMVYSLISGGTDNMAQGLNYIIMGIMSFMIMSAICKFCGKMQHYYDQCVFSKDRMLDRAKDNTERINESQKTIRETNEQLGIKKFELEEAYRKINVSIADNNFQNKFLRLLISTFDLNELAARARELFEDIFELEFCGLIFKNKKLRERYDSGIGKFFSEEDFEQFSDFFLSSAFINQHKEIDSNFIENEVSYDEFPFFRARKINSVAVKAIVTDNSQYSCIYVMFSSQYNLFREKTKLLENIFGQMDIAARNMSNYYKAEELSIKDALSGLYNRRYLNLYFKDNFVDKTHEGRLALAMLDIDHFKNINDTYGHLFGDQAIKMVSELILKCADDNDGTGFRYGGEEFVIIFENRMLSEIIAIIDKLRNDIRSTAINSDDGASITVKVSVGVSAYPETTDAIHTLVDRADKAMYYSKQNGRNRLTVDGTYEGEK